MTTENQERRDDRSVRAKRLDALVDSAFALAMTLLVIGSAGRPMSVDQLFAELGRVPAFAISLVFLVAFWLEHRNFGSMIAERDRVMDALELLIVFVVVIYVLPLGLLTEAAFHWLSDAALPGRGLLPDQVRGLYTAYGIGFVALSALFAGLHLYAASCRGDFAIDPTVEWNLRRHSLGWGTAVMVGLVSIAMARWLPAELVVWVPGAIYLLAPVAALTIRSASPGPSDDSRAGHLHLE